MKPDIATKTRRISRPQNCIWKIAFCLVFDRPRNSNLGLGKILTFVLRKWDFRSSFGLRYKNSTSPKFLLLPPLKLEMSSGFLNEFPKFQIYLGNICIFRDFFKNMSRFDNFNFPRPPLPLETLPDQPFARNLLFLSKKILKNIFF